MSLQRASTATIVLFFGLILLVAALLMLPSVGNQVTAIDWQPPQTTGGIVPVNQVHPITRQQALELPGVDAPNFPLPAPQQVPEWTNDGKVRIPVYTGSHNGLHDLTNPTTYGIAELVLSAKNGSWQPPEDDRVKEKIRCFAVLVLDQGVWYFDRGYVWIFSRFTNTVKLARGLMVVYNNERFVTTIADQSEASLLNQPKLDGHTTKKVKVDCNRLQPPGLPPFAAVQ